MKSRYRSLFLLWSILIAFSLLSRTALLVKALPNLELTTWLVVKIYAVGFYFDCVTFSYLAIPFTLAALALPDRIFNSRPFKALSYLVLFVFTYLMLFCAVAEIIFFDEFATRFNFIAVDYLIYTSEVVNNIRQSYPLNKILTGLLVLTVVLFPFLKRALASSFCATSTFPRRIKPGLVLLLLPLLSLKLVDVSQAHISPNNCADELAGNGIYQLFAAFRNNELDFNKFYATRDHKVVMGKLRQLLMEKDNQLANSDGRDITRLVQHAGGERRLNVIVVVEESLSAKYLGTFGDPHGLTPNLDRLASESMLFTHLYATGTRTVRGLEAITLAIPPLPGTSLIKRPGNEKFFSWGSVMKEKGYDTKFIYGGRGYFDNMNYFFANNGFDIVDRLQFAKDEVTFDNAWGVCDEDLFMKVIKECDKSVQQGKPAFSVVMTTSNHRPFTYPEGKIKLASKSGREGGVMYADYAVGRLIAEAKKHAWFKDTVFVIVADHCANSARKAALPVKDYEIPLLIYAPALIKPQRVDALMSQIDIAPTVLGLLNFSYTSKFMGRDVLKPGEGERRAFISTYQKLGFVQGNKLLVLGPRKELSCYLFDRGDGRTTEIPADERLLLDGLAYYQGTDYVYRNRLNRLGN